jgi:hypothetical protein
VLVECVAGSPLKTPKCRTESSLDMTSFLDATEPSPPDSGVSRLWDGMVTWSSLVTIAASSHDPEGECGFDCAAATSIRSCSCRATESVRPARLRAQACTHQLSRSSWSINYAEKLEHTGATF